MACYMTQKPGVCVYTKQIHLLATEMYFWQRTASISRKEKIGNLKIREIMNVHYNITEAMEERRLRSVWTFEDN